MSKKKLFLNYVAVEADTQNTTRLSGDTDKSLVLHVAGMIPEDRIPHNVLNAAKVFLAFCNGVCKRPHPWMLAR